MTANNLVVIGASAGGVEALLSLFSQLPSNLNAAVLVVLHVPATGTSILPTILNRKSHMPASHITNGQEMHPHHIYIAPPNFHMMVSDGKMLLSSGPRVNGVRPSIDTLFLSAAQSQASRLIGVILSGTMMDGTMGLRKIEENGGDTIVQDPAEAAFPGLPLHAIEKVDVDYVLPIEEIAGTIVRLMQEPPKRRAKFAAELGMEEEQQELHTDHELFAGGGNTSPRSLLTCPECGGVLWEVTERGIVQYVCQVGHTFSEESMVSEQDGAVEHALWSAVRILEEKAMLSRRLASRAEEYGMRRSTQSFLQAADDAEAKGNAIRSLLKGSAGPVEVFETANEAGETQDNGSKADL